MLGVNINDLYHKVLQQQKKKKKHETAYILWIIRILCKSEEWITKSDYNEDYYKTIVSISIFELIKNQTL